MEHLELTPQERDQILKAREARRINDAGAYGPAPKLDDQQSKLLADLDELNGQGLAGGYGRLPSGLLDAETVALIQKVQEVGFRMRISPYNDARPFLVPTRVAASALNRSPPVVSRCPHEHDLSWPLY
jgi:hypothetical protein